MFPHHNYLNISLTVFGGIYLFFVIERLLKIVMDARARRAEEVMVEHSHSHSVETVVVSSDSQLAACLDRLGIGKLDWTLPSTPHATSLTMLYASK